MQVYNRLHDSVWFNQVQITDVPEPVPVHFWLDHILSVLFTAVGTWYITSFFVGFHTIGLDFFYMVIHIS